MTYDGGTVGGEVSASSHHDHTNGSKNDHEEEAFSTTPDIEDLGQGNVDSSSHAVGDDANDGNERVRLPLTAGVGNKSVIDLTLETVGEVDQPHATRLLVHDLNCDKT
jgi:hypothetical protein